MRADQVYPEASRQRLETSVLGRVGDLAGLHPHCSCVGWSAHRRRGRGPGGSRGSPVALGGVLAGALGARGARGGLICEEAEVGATRASTTTGGAGRYPECPSSDRCFMAVGESSCCRRRRGSGTLARAPGAAPRAAARAAPSSCGTSDT